MRLPHRITFTQEIETLQDSGSVEVSWGNLFGVWAELKPLKSFEQYSHQKLSIKSDFSLTVRHSSEIIDNVTSESRIAYEGRVFEVVSKPTDFKIDNKYLTILLKEIDG